MSCACLTPPVLGLFCRPQSELQRAPSSVTVGAQQVPLLLVRHPRARRYLLRLRTDGTARVTIPGRGSISEALAFVERNIPWLEQQLARHRAQPQTSSAWSIGTEILLRGERVRLELDGPGLIRVGDEVMRVAPGADDLRPAVEAHLRKRATRELSARLADLATQHGLRVQRIAIRNQRTRWGSCSRRGTISLNWRLIQTPDYVRDYICLHELAHLLEMNHSARFWQHVERLCPDYLTAERWLKQHPRLLG